MCYLNNENILKEIFNNYSTLLNKQLLEMTKNKMIAENVILTTLSYQKIFNSMGKSHVIMDVQEYSANFFALHHSGYILAGLDGAVRIWNVKKYLCINVIKGSYVSSLSILEDKRIIACFQDKIEIWGEFIDDEDKFELLKTLRLFGHYYYESPLLFTNGKMLCLAFNHEDSYVLIFDINNQSDIKVIKDNVHYRSPIVISPNNKFAIGTDQASINIWDINDYSFKTLEGHNHLITSLFFVDKNNLLLSGSDLVIKVWDINNYKCIRTINAHDGYVTCLLLLPCGYFASGSDDKKIKLWDLKDFKCVNILEGHTSGVDYLLLLTDKRLASASKEIIIWSY
jgi:WD40 repeat protein